MNGTLPALLRLGNAPRSRFALATVLGALTVVFGVGLMATAGYLISRAAEHPPILSLTVAIVAVRVFGLGRPLMRYLERLASHDVALRVLGRVRAAFYARIEPLAPAQLDGYRRGDLLSRMVADVDALQDLLSAWPRTAAGGAARGRRRGWRRRSPAARRRARAGGWSARRRARRARAVRARSRVGPDGGRQRRVVSCPPT